jgi:Nucleotidyltransferase
VLGPATAARATPARTRPQLRAPFRRTSFSAVLPKRPGVTTPAIGQAAGVQGAGLDSLVDATLATQIRATERVLRRNPIVEAVLERGRELRLSSWYLGAGGVTQTVWNELHGFEPTRGIKDYDLVYFDATDLTNDRERAVEDDVATLFADLDVSLTVVPW